MDLKEDKILKVSLELQPFFVTNINYMFQMGLIWDINDF